MDELLQLARQLRPTALDDHGLMPALRHAGARLRRAHGRRRATFAARGDVPPLTAEQQLVVYRVAQESLSNVAQHAGAERVDVELSFVGAHRAARRATTGAGFADGADAQRRARAVGHARAGPARRAASSTIRSTAAGGTTVELTMQLG